MSSLVRWVEGLLFGARTLEPVPPELATVSLRLHARGISVSEAVLRGGLVHSPSLVAGDLDRLVEYFEQRARRHRREADPRSGVFEASTPLPSPVFQTGTVTRTFNHLLVALQKDEFPPRPAPSDHEGDEALFHALLAGDVHAKPPAYGSARFWGEWARRLLNDRRPLPKTPAPLAVRPPASWIDRIVRLYDVTAKTWGRWFDPLDCVLVPRDQYVDPVHFRSGDLLRAFLEHRPEHALSAAVRDWTRRFVLDPVLRCQPLPATVVDRAADLSLLTRNVVEVDRRVRNVEDAHALPPPPKLVDVFQRLVACCGLDHLWLDAQEEDEGASSERKNDDAWSSPLDRWELLRRLDALERQNAFLVSLLRRDGGER